MRNFKTKFSSAGTFLMIALIMAAFLIIFSNCALKTYPPVAQKIYPPATQKSSPQEAFPPGVQKIYPPAAQKTFPPADLVLFNGVIYTADPDNPESCALVITGNKITAVCGHNSEVGKYIGDKTKSIDLAGKFVTPGIIDGHVHFNGAGALIIDANLMTVSDEEGLRKKVRRVVEILDDEIGRAHV